jgi:hypothetical protein
MKTKKLSNKVGRKALPPELTKTRVATVRLRPHDRVLVEHDARRMTVGEFCEMLSFGLRCGKGVCHLTQREICLQKHAELVNMKASLATESALKHKGGALSRPMICILPRYARMSEVERLRYFKAEKQS